MPITTTALRAGLGQRRPASARRTRELDPADDDAYALLVSVAPGEIDDVATIARRLERFVRA
jgi:hypothetical protein